jgi:putative copper resistance protein D
VNEPIDLLLVATRLVEFVAAFGLFGFAAFQAYAPPDLRGSGGPFYRVILPVVAGIAALGWGLAIAYQIGGGIDVSVVTLLGRIWLTTGFGRALLTASLLGLTMALTGLGGGRRRWLGLGLGAALLIALSFVGHAAGSGLAGGARLGVKATHLLAAGVWLGGLPPLAWALRRQSPSTVILLRRFGTLGGVAVTLVLATGLVSIAFVVEIAGGRLGHLYTRVLIVKLALVLGLLAVAALNRFRLTPMMARRPHEALTALRRTVLLEQVLAFAILASVATLGQLDPAM